MTLTAHTDTPESYPQGVEARPVYLDCNATTPMDPRVAEEVVEWTVNEFGNAGSRTHSYGQAAKNRVKRSRDEIAAVVAAQPDEVTFTSGATESNNLAILGLAKHGLETDRRHLVCTAIEHKAVLEPMGLLESQGFEVTYVAPSAGGRVDASAVIDAVRSDTLLVSVMAVNNETGVIQPVADVAAALDGHDALLHVDAAQAYGKLISALTLPRIDMISISGHKIHAPKGIGALVARRRRFKRPPLQPLMHGGGQERGLRPGTLPVGLIAGLGAASRYALAEHAAREQHCRTIRDRGLHALTEIDTEMNGDVEHTVSHTLNVSVPGVDSEAAIVALKELVAISNGSACTSQSYEPSHVLLSAGLSPQRIAGALRFSWSYLTPAVDWSAVVRRLSLIRMSAVG